MIDEADRDGDGEINQEESNTTGNLNTDLPRIAQSSSYTHLTIHSFILIHIFWSQ
jgi:hypothetical protein